MASELPSGDREKLEKLCKDWFSDKKPRTLTILVTGKTGVGKSRLVNALVGKNVAKEGRKKDPCTSKVSCHEANIEGVTVTVWDSPGLQDGTTKEAEYIQDMKTKIQDVALMIYCVRMDDTRFYEADKKAIQILTDDFGKEVWNHAVVALTFANKVEDPDEGDELEYFQFHVQDWKKQLKDHFKAVNPEAVDIPVIPAGNSRKMRLPDRENWLSDLWIKCYKVMKASARQGMYRINEKRLGRSVSASPTSPYATASRYSSEAECGIPNAIPFQDRHLKSFWKATMKSILSVGGAVLSGVATVGLVALEIFEIGNGSIGIAMKENRLTLNLSAYGIKLLERSIKFS